MAKLITLNFYGDFDKGFEITVTKNVTFCYFIDMLRLILKT